MFALPGYDAFLGFLLIAAAVPALALITNKLVAPKSRAGERQLTYESGICLLYTSPSPRDKRQSRMPSSA